MEKMLDLEPACYARHRPDWVSISLGIFICVGTVVGFLPQHYSLLRRRSHLGISFAFLFLNNFGNFCNTIEGVIDQWDDILCCAKVGPWQCTTLLLVFLQLGINWFCLFIVYALSLYYFEYDGTVKSYNERVAARYSFMINLLIVAFGTGTAFVFLFCMETGEGSPAAMYTKVLGYVSAIVPIFVWTPQLYTTYKMRSPGTLSLGTQIIQTPGSFIQAFFQMYSGFWRVGLTATVSGFEQLALTLMMIYFIIRNDSPTIKAWLRRNILRQKGGGGYDSSTSSGCCSFSTFDTQPLLSESALACEDGTSNGNVICYGDGDAISYSNGNGIGKGNLYLASINSDPSDKLLADDGDSDCDNDQRPPGN